ncbi:MAG: cysteine hydrolase [Lachnospiraceae bacterium]|nr:cysteine hydrolase [Lachnospiraceae bacterium]
MKKLLIVVDMQNDFIDGSLGTPEALAIVEAVKEKIRSYPPEDVIATMDTHETDYLSTQEGKFLPVEHCIRDTHGWEIREDIMELLDEAEIYEKPTFACEDLAQDLRGYAMDMKARADRLNEIAENPEETVGEQIELELVGLCTDICVVSNALLLKALMPEVKISVDSSCCAGVTPEKHAAALETMRSCQVVVK